MQGAQTREPGHPIPSTAPCRCCRRAWGRRCTAPPGWTPPHTPRTSAGSSLPTKLGRVAVRKAFHTQRRGHAQPQPSPKTPEGTSWSALLAARGRRHTCNAPRCTPHSTPPHLHPLAPHAPPHLLQVRLPALALRLLLHARHAVGGGGVGAHLLLGMAPAGRSGCDDRASGQELRASRRSKCTWASSSRSHSKHASRHSMLDPPAAGDGAEGGAIHGWAHAPCLLLPAHQQYHWRSSAVAWRQACPGGDEILVL